VHSVSEVRNRHAHDFYKRAGHLKNIMHTYEIVSMTYKNFHTFNRISILFLLEKMGIVNFHSNRLA
jgi:hypothetical protein